jgi:hypothetical protein
MTTNDAVSSDLIELPADPFTVLASRKRKNVIAAVLMVSGVALSTIGGPTAVVIGGCLFVVAIVVLRQHYYIATFDLARRQVSVVNINFLHTRRRTLPFDAIQWLDLEPGRGGAALWLKDGSKLMVAAPPDDYGYAKLDRHLAEIRKRTGLPAARTSPAHADVNSGVSSDRTGLIKIEPPNHHAVPRVIGGVVILLMTAVAVGGGILMLFTTPMPKGFGEWFGFFILLAGIPLWLLISTFGVYLLFGSSTKLLLDPATRKLRVEGGFLKPRVETIAFEDVTSAGVIHESGREGSSFFPYLILRSHRLIRLHGLGDNDFRSSDEIAELIRQMTGATRKNIG